MIILLFNNVDVLWNVACPGTGAKNFINPHNVNSFIGCTVIQGEIRILPTTFFGFALLLFYSFISTTYYFSSTCYINSMSCLCYKHDVCLSVCLSVVNAGGWWSHSATENGNWHIVSWLTAVRKKHGIILVVSCDLEFYWERTVTD